MKILERANHFLAATGMTQQQLAAELGVHPVSLSRVLNGHSGRETIILKLDEFLDANGFPHSLEHTQKTQTEEQ